MNLLLTAGPTHEPIDPVRFLGNRSSGRMGAAIAQAALDAGHKITLIAGPVSIPMPKVTNRIDVQTAAEMREAVLSEFASHDLLIMAAAVADFRPIRVSDSKLSRSQGLTIECEPTEDILASTSKIKTARQRTVGFSLESTPASLEELNGRPIGRVLTKIGKVTREQVVEALDYQKKNGGLFGAILIDQGLVENDDVNFALAAQRGQGSAGAKGKAVLAARSLDRARGKLVAKGLDLIVFNPAETMDSTDVHATLLWPDGRIENEPAQTKQQFATLLIAKCQSLFAS